MPQIRANGIRLHRVFLCLSALLVQAWLLGQFFISLRIRSSLWGQHGRPCKSGDKDNCNVKYPCTKVEYFGSHAHLSMSMSCDQPPNHLLEERGGNASVGMDTTRIDFVDLSINPGIQSDFMKLHMPDMYRNVNYTLSNQLARPFPIWQHPFPCFPSESDWYTLDRQRTPAAQGFFYFKARKAASSTVAGVALRIAKSKARQQLHLSPKMNGTDIHHGNNSASATTTTTSICKTRVGHSPARRMNYHQRDRLRSFLWTIIREPTHRDVSEFFHFGVSRAKIQPSRQMFQRYYRTTPLLFEYYLQFMSTVPALDANMYQQLENDYVRMVGKIMLDYDFIGITERMHESLVTLQLILNLTTSDILVLNAKTNGEWDDGMFRGQCTFIQPPIVSPALSEYLQSDEWMREKRGSNLLYATVNRSLDMTIASLDPTQFQEQLRRYTWALEQAKTRCRDKVRFPCSPEGVRQEQHDCLLWDSGCGNDCIDEASQELGL